VLAVKDIALYIMDKEVLNVCTASASNLDHCNSKDRMNSLQKYNWKANKWRNLNHYTA
jgi:hypothetical protein